MKPATAGIQVDSNGEPAAVTRSVVWFKRDLRLHDHRPLCDAIARGRIVGLYVHEPLVLSAREFAPGHLAFVDDCLAELGEGLRRLGSDLVVRHGPIVEVLDRLHETWRFDRLWSHEETGLAATYDRDRAVAAWCRRRDVTWTEHPQHGVFRPLPSRDGWAARWRRRMNPAPLPAPGEASGPTREELERLGRETAPTAASMGIADDGMSSIQAGGEREAHATLGSFLFERGEPYQRAMSTPIEGWDACSRLSPHLAYGSISIRTVFHATRDRATELRGRPDAGTWRKSISSFEKRLRWHCHFIQKLEDEPAIEFENFNRAFDGMRQEDRDAWSDAERDRFEAFIAARTGYPLVDACLRCLDRTGWINFRMRAMLVSFASYHLWLHWKPVAEHLATRFLDFEPGIHYSQCQMQAGTTGINTVRIYSPIKQVADQDPKGEFIRRWVPELREVPTEFIARPETMPALTQGMAGCEIGRDYPAPIVEHAIAYREAKARVFAARGTKEARREAGRVYAKHGSRRRSSDTRPSTRNATTS